jgi:hypothetical protein
LFVTPEGGETDCRELVGQFQLAPESIDLDEAKTRGSQQPVASRFGSGATGAAVGHRRVPQVIAAPPPVAPATNIEVIGRTASTVKFGGALALLMTTSKRYQ